MWRQRVNLFRPHSLSATEISFEICQITPVRNELIRPRGKSLPLISQNAETPVCIAYHGCGFKEGLCKFVLMVLLPLCKQTMAVYHVVNCTAWVRLQLLAVVLQQNAQSFLIRRSRYHPLRNAGAILRAVINWKSWVSPGHREQGGYECSGPAINPNLQPFEV